MIKIKRISAPEQLTDVVKLQLTEEFKKDKKKPYGIKLIYANGY